jgi:hypothetical protein
MDYSFFLFSKLADLHLDTDYAYDDLYEDLKHLYQVYQHSEYNVDTKGEYECMLDFFKANTEFNQLITE